MKLAYTRAIVDAIHSVSLTDAPVEPDPVFGVHVVTKCPNVPEKILIPKNTWSDEAAFNQTAKKLAKLFCENFKKYEAGVDDAVRAAGPQAS